PESGDAACERGRETLEDLGDAVARELPDAVGRRVAIGLVQRLDDLANKVDEVKVDAAPADLEAEGQRALRVERVGDRGLTDAPALRTAAAQQAVRLELVHDDRNGLRGEAGEARDVRLGQFAPPADQRQDQPL